MIITSTRPVKRMGQGLKAGNQAAYTDGEGNDRDMHHCQSNQEAAARHQRTIQHILRLFAACQMKQIQEAAAGRGVTIHGTSSGFQQVPLPRCES